MPISFSVYKNSHGYKYNRNNNQHIIQISPISGNPKGYSRALNFLKGKSHSKILFLLDFQKEVNAVLTESATLSCEVAQDATEVKWFKDGKLLITSRKFKIESVGKTRRLVIGQLEKKDAGEYICEAAGQKLTFKLKPTGEYSL
uniref:Ig-like domain-containing protein n=1 Tax=Strigops habroptila TaxID=2489341 RepID=A0A672TQM8_STRHB